LTGRNFLYDEMRKFLYTRVETEYSYAPLLLLGSICHTGVKQGTPAMPAEQREWH